jgi:hypothetical protein
VGRTDGAAWRGRLAFLGDRIVVLFIGVGVGAMIALAYVSGGTLRLGAQGPRAAAPVAATAAPPRLSPPPTPAALDCATPFPPRLAERIALARPVTVGVFGDSFGEGVWAALHALLAKDNVVVVEESRLGAGFTRYQTLDLERAAAESLATRPVDIAVIMIGANDTQGVFDDAGRHAYALMTPGWKAVYGARIDRFVRRLRDQGALVYWIGLPVMRQADYDRDIAALNDFLAARMAAQGVPFLPTRALSVDPEGRFNLYLPGPGEAAPPRMRANDGVHMTFAGYERLARPVAERIHAYLAAAARISAQAPAPETPRA